MPCRSVVVFKPKRHSHRLLNLNYLLDVFETTPLRDRKELKETSIRERGHIIILFYIFPCLLSKWSAPNGWTGRVVRLKLRSPKETGFLIMCFVANYLSTILKHWSAPVLTGWESWGFLCKFRWVFIPVFFRYSQVDSNKYALICPYLALFTTFRNNVKIIKGSSKIFQVS